MIPLHEKVVKRMRAFAGGSSHAMAGIRKSSIAYSDGAAHASHASLALREP